MKNRQSKLAENIHYMKIHKYQAIDGRKQLLKCQQTVETVRFIRLTVETVLYIRSRVETSQLQLLKAGIVHTKP